MKYKYYYNGEPLAEFCRKHPEYRYNQISKYISIKLKEDSTRSIDDIIIEYMNKSHRTNTRYIINGMNLSRYCMVMNISYDAVTQDISRSKKDPRYSDMDEDEIVSMVLDKHLTGTTDLMDLMSDSDKGKKLTLNQ